MERKTLSEWLDEIEDKYGFCDEHDTLVVYLTKTKGKPIIFQGILGLEYEEEILDDKYGNWIVVNVIKSMVGHHQKLTIGIEKPWQEAEWVGNKNE